MITYTLRHKRYSYFCCLYVTVISGIGIAPCVLVRACHGELERSFIRSVDVAPGDSSAKPSRKGERQRGVEGEMQP